MTIKERAHNFATDYAPFSDHTNLEIGYVKGAEEQETLTKQDIVDKACKLLCNICYFGKSASSPHSHCKICKAEGGDYYRFTKLVEE